MGVPSHKVEPTIELRIEHHSSGIAEGVERVEVDGRTFQCCGDSILELWHQVL